MTTRERIIAELEEHPDGLSKSALQKRVGANPGVLRGLLSSMVLSGTLEVEEVETDHGTTQLHKLKAQTTE